jgi:hypothetical protein
MVSKIALSQTTGKASVNRRLFQRYIRGTCGKTPDAPGIQKSKASGQRPGQGMALAVSPVFFPALFQQPAASTSTSNQQPATSNQHPTLSTIKQHLIF